MFIALKLALSFLVGMAVSIFIIKVDNTPRDGLDRVVGIPFIATLAFIVCLVGFVGSLIATIWCMGS